MYNETQLAALKLFGDKTLSFGCYYKYDGRKPIFRVNREGMMASLEKDKITILGHEPHLFPDVARELQRKGYVLELLKIDTIKSVLKISRFDLKKDILISYKKLIPLLSQPNLSEIVNLFSK